MDISTKCSAVRNKQSKCCCQLEVGTQEEKMMIVTACVYYRCKHYVTAVYNLMNLLTELKTRNHGYGSEWTKNECGCYCFISFFCARI